MCEEKLGPWGEIASALKADLIRFEVDRSNLLVHLPVSYPGGAGVVVKIATTLVYKKYFVSDMGYGAREARNILAEQAYEKIAKTRAEQAGLRFDATSVFCDVDSVDKLAGVIQAVAEVSVSAFREAFAEEGKDETLAPGAVRG